MAQVPDFRTNLNLTGQYLNQLTKLNAESKHPGYFSMFTANGDKSPLKPRFEGDDGNVYEQNPKYFYQNSLLNLRRHNWFSITTFRKVTPEEHQQMITHLNNKAKNATNPKKSRKYAMKAQHLNTALNHQPFRRKDDFVANFLGNYVDIDCMQNGVNPRDFMSRFTKALKNPKIQKKFSLIQPTVIQNSGHGVYFVFLYKHPFEVNQSDSNIAKSQIQNWKNTEQVLVRNLNRLTTKWYGKALGDIKSTNPARILRMPNTYNVKNLDSKTPFTRPYASYLKEYTNHTYNYNDLSNYADKLSPLFPEKIRGAIEKHQGFEPFNLNSNQYKIFWTQINAMQSKVRPNQAIKNNSMFNPSLIRINQFKYGKYIPKFILERRAKALKKSKYPHGFNQYNALDWLSYHKIPFKQVGKQILFPPNALIKGTQHDNSSVHITQVANNYGKYGKWGYQHHLIRKDQIQTISLLNRLSGYWNNVIGTKWVGNKEITSRSPKALQKKARSLDSITELIMLHDNISKPSVAKKKRLQWFKKMNKMGIKKTKYPYNKYGEFSNSSTSSNKTRNPNGLDVAESNVYMDSAMKYIYRKINEAKQHVEDLKKGYATSDLKFPPEKANRIIKQARQKANWFVNTKMINNNIAKDYLVYARAYTPEFAQKLINNGYVRGYNGYNKPKYKKDSKGHLIMGDDDKLVKAGVQHFDPYIEFVHRAPRNSAEAHMLEDINPKFRDTPDYDLKLSLGRKEQKDINNKIIPMTYAKEGQQSEIPNGSDKIFLIAQKYVGKDGKKHILTRTGKDNKQHIVYVKDTRGGNKKLKDKGLFDPRANQSGKSIDPSGNRAYGYKTHTGNGLKNLYIFEAPVDLGSFFDMHEHSKNPAEREAVKNSTGLALCGSSTKAKFVQNFLDRNFATNHDFPNVIVCTDNDKAGYAVATKLCSQYGNLNAYIKHPKDNQRRITVDIPESQDRPESTDVLRKGAHIKNDKYPFAKDWNDEEQQLRFNNGHFNHVAKHMNIVQYEHLIPKQEMIDIEEIDLKNGKNKGLNNEQMLSHINKDMEAVDTIAHLSNHIYQNKQNNKEQLDVGNPRIRGIHQCVSAMSTGHLDNQGHDIDGAQHCITGYMNETGNYTSPQIIQEGMDKSFKDAYHHPNKVLQSKTYYSMANTPYEPPKVFRQAKESMTQMKNPEAKRLYATAIHAISNVWRRRIYGKCHDTYQGQQYLKKYYQAGRVYTRDPRVKKINVIQSVIDDKVRRRCFAKLQKNYPKDFVIANKLTPDVSKLANFDKTGKKPYITSKNAVHDIISNKCVYNFMKNSGMKEYQAKDILSSKKDKDFLNKYSAVIDSNNKSVNKMIAHRTRAKYDRINQNNNLNKSKKILKHYQNSDRTPFNHSQHSSKFSASDRSNSGVKPVNIKNNQPNNSKKQKILYQKKRKQGVNRK